VGRETSFSDLGGDSFGAIELLFEIEDRFGVTIPPATFIGGSSIAAVAALLRARAPEKPALKLVPLNASGRLPPLFIPYGPGAAVGYAGAISEALGPDQPIYCFQAPAGDHDVAEPESMEEKAAKMIELIVGVQPEGPYYVIGYSFQSHVAYEIAQQLHDRGAAVAFLGIIDDSADLERRRPGVENFPPKKRTTGALNLWAIERYVPKPYAGRVTLFRAAIPAEIYQADATAGWGGLALGGVETFDAAGDHAHLVTRDGFGWGALLGVVLARARRAAVLQPAGAKELAKAVRQARSLVTGKTTRHAIDARVAAKRGDRAGEIAAYRKALAAGDAPAWARRNLGHALIENGQIDAGIKLLEETLASDPWPSKSAVSLAEVYVAHGRQDRLAKLREAMREVLVDEPQVMLHWGHLCRIAGDFAEAETAMRRAVVLADRTGTARDYSADVRSSLAELLAGRGRADEAIVVAREAFEMFPSDAGRCMRLAGLVARTGNRAEAANWYRRALEIEPKLEEARAALVALPQR
jgi:Tfp pilus assembly protein PilF